MIKAKRGRSHRRYLDVTVPSWLKAAAEVLPDEASLFQGNERKETFI